MRPMLDASPPPAPREFAVPEKIDRFGQMIRTALGLALDASDAEVIAHAAVLRRIADTRKDVDPARVDVVADPQSSTHRCQVPSVTAPGMAFFCMVCTRQWRVEDGVWVCGPRRLV